MDEKEKRTERMAKLADDMLALQKAYVLEHAKVGVGVRAALAECAAVACVDAGHLVHLTGMQEELAIELILTGANPDADVTVSVEPIGAMYPKPDGKSN